MDGINNTDLDLNKDIEIVLGDIRDRTFVGEQILDVDCVFNLAALIGIPYSYHAAESYIDTNVRGCLNILESAKKEVVELFRLQLLVYGTAQFVPITEDLSFSGSISICCNKDCSRSISHEFL